MSLWIEKKQDGTLLVPLWVEDNKNLGDGIVEIKKNSVDYQRYLNLYNEEQKRRKLFNL